MLKTIDFFSAALALRHQARRKRRVAVNRRERTRPGGPNQVWSMDFVADQLADGQRFRLSGLFPQLGVLGKHHSV
ncbi:MAG: hypothetical protein HYX73_02200 [Acidobacteria bacterium]|nr:hypothetical protein [Acidobacteriota bacterium]